MKDSMKFVEKGKQEVEGGESCVSCRMWRKWSELHQREMLELEEKLIEKEGKMVGVLKKQREELRILKETVKGTILKNIGLEGKLEADHH